VGIHDRLRLGGESLCRGSHEIDEALEAANEAGCYGGR
jgi:hypothetical protein